MAAMDRFSSALSYLEGLYYQGIKLGLRNTYRMLACVNNPHRELRCIHVGGTNGKGSVSSMLATALAYSRLTVGLYTSPHLISIRERLRINGKAISENDFADLVFHLRERIEGLFDEETDRGPTFFEFITVLALLYFKRKDVDLAVIEVGMGGRLDSTNVITPILSVITQVDYDHTKPLGNDLKTIASEKAGIIKQGIPVVCGDPKHEVRGVIDSHAVCKAARVYMIEREFDTIEYNYQNRKTGVVQHNLVRWQNRDINIATSLLGRHQSQNTSIVFAALMVLQEFGLEFSIQKAMEGIENTTWPGRLQILPGGIIVDVAHNLNAVTNTINTVLQLYPGTKWNIMFGVMRDKDWPAMLKKLLVVAKKVYLVEAANRRSESSRCINDYISGHIPTLSSEICDSVHAALNKLRGEQNGLVVGSSYVAGEVLSIYCDNSNLNVLDIS